MEVFNVTQFILKFPIGTILSVDEFDDWAIKSLLINDPETDDRNSAQWQLLLKQRNSVRSELNRIAVRGNNDFIPMEDEKFSVEVHAYGESYRVKSISDHFADKALKLPSKIMNNIDTRSKQLDILVSSTDLDKLPTELRMRVGMVSRSTERLKRTLTFTLGEAQLELEEIFTEVRKHSNGITDSNDGVAAISDQSSQHQGDS